MPDTFAITPAAASVPLDAARHASARFTVGNNSGRALRARARIVPADPTAAPWLTLDGDAERGFSVTDPQDFVVQITVPPGAAPGSYTFRLDVIGVDNPDDEFAEGPPVAFTVPVPPPVAKPFPWWVVAVAAVLVIVVGVGVFLVLDNARATSAAAQFEGVWMLSAGDINLRHDGTAIQGSYNDYLSSQSGRIEGNVSSSGTLNGHWTLPNNQTGSLAMTIDPAAQTLAGADPFCGARSDHNLPAGCSFAGTWQDNKGCTLTFAVKAGGEVTGAACGEADTLSGNISWIPSPPTVGLNGNYSVGGTNMGFTIYLRNHATQFAGQFQPGQGGGEWCASRPGQPLPTPCAQAAP